MSDAELAKTLSVFVRAIRTLGQQYPGLLAVAADDLQNAILSLDRDRTRHIDASGVRRGEWADGAEVPHFRTYAFPREALEVVEPALQRAAELSNSKSPSRNLELICTDFLMTNAFRKAGLKQKLAYLAKLEHALELNFIVFDPREQCIVFGIEILEKLAARVRQDEIATETPIEPDDLADFHARWAVSFDRVTDADVPVELWDPTTELAMRAQVDWCQGEPS